MKQEKVNKNLSTIWLDFVNYVFMPFYILTISLNLIKCFNNITVISVILSILLVLCILFSFFTFYQLLKRKKAAYYCLLVFNLISLTTLIFDIIKKYHIDNLLLVLIIIVIGIIFWLVPNYFYLRKRKYLFKEHQLLNIKKCPGCKRIIPISMKYCGRCDYKEESHNVNNI